MLCCVSGYSGPSSGRVFIIIRVLFVVFSLLLSSAERRIKYIRRRRIFRLCWHWGLRASNSRSPPTRHTSSESTWEERKKEKKKKKTVENRVHPIINFHILLHFPSSFAFIYIFIYLKKRNPFFFGHRFTPPGNQLKTCWYGYKILKLHGKSFFHPCEKPKKKKGRKIGS